MRTTTPSHQKKKKSIYLHPYPYIPYPHILLPFLLQQTLYSLCSYLKLKAMLLTHPKFYSYDATLYCLRHVLKSPCYRHVLLWCSYHLFFSSTELLQSAVHTFCVRFLNTWPHFLHAPPMTLYPLCHVKIRPVQYPKASIFPQPVVNSYPHLTQTLSNSPVHPP